MQAGVRLRGVVRDVCWRRLRAERAILLGRGPEREAGQLQCRHNKPKAVDAMDGMSMMVRVELLGLVATHPTALSLPGVL